MLTLTATPIPRTLHMSLIGIRDMSVLEEAPMDRMPIQTYVMEYNDEISVKQLSVNSPEVDRSIMFITEWKILQMWHSVCRNWCRMQEYLTHMDR